MARPRKKLFYETPLPDFLPPEKEWLRDYHRNSRNVVEYMARNGAKSTAYHAAIRALTLFREYLLQNGICFSPVAATQWCAGNAPLVKGYEITFRRLLDFYQYGSVQPIHAFPYAIQYSTQNTGWGYLMASLYLCRIKQEIRIIRLLSQMQLQDSCMAYRSQEFMIFHRLPFLFWKNTATGTSIVRTTRTQGTLTLLAISFMRWQSRGSAHSALGGIHTSG